MLQKILFVAALLFVATAHAQVKTGQVVPPFDTRLLDGKTLPAQALKGKVVLVVYWATWCPPCQRELPELQALYEKHRGKGFEILALSIDADKFTVEEFWKDHDYHFPVAMIVPAHTRALGKVKATPTLHLIDRQGKLNLVRLGPMDQDKLEARLLPLL